MARYVDGTGANIAALSNINIALAAGTSSVCTLTSSTAVIPAGLSTTISQFGTIRSTTTAGTCNVTGTASGGFTGSVTATTVITTALDRVVLPAGLLVGPASSSTFTVLLTGPAPTAPVTVNLSMVNTGIATVAPTAVIAAGTSSASVVINGGVAGTTTLQATATGYVGTTTVVTVKTVTMDFYPSSGFTVSAFTPTTRQVLLSDAAPPGGVVVGVSILDTTKATLSTSSVVIPAGQLLSPSFTITWAGYGSTTLTATATGITTRNLGFSTAPAPSISVTCYYYCPSVGTGLYLPASYYYGYLVHLSNAAPSDLVVTLNSSAPGVLTVPASVTVLAGQTDTWFRTDGVGVGTSTVGASAASWTSGSRVLTGAATDIRMNGYNTSRTTLTAPEAVSSYVSCGGSFCGYTPTPVAVTYAVTSASPSGLVAFDNATATIAADNNGSDGAGVIGTPSAAGTYKITPSAAGFTSIESSQTVTVVQPSISVTCYYYCPSVGTGLYLPASYYYGFLVHLSNAAPSDLVVTLNSSAPGVLTVPASVTVLAGQTDTWFRTDGVGVGTSTVSASAAGWTSGSRALNDAAPDIRMNSFSTSRTTLSAPEAVSSFISCGGSFCGYTPTPVAVTYAVTSASPSGLVAFDNATATIAADNNGSNAAGVIGTPTAAGTYKITPSATGFTSIQSAQTVTVVQPSISVTCYYYCPSVGTGLYLPASYYYGFLVHLSNAAPSDLVVTLSSSAPGVLTVPASVTVPTGQSDIWFRVDGVGVGTSTVSASAAGWTSGSRVLADVAPDIRMNYFSTSRTTLSAPEAVSSFISCGGSFCGYAPAPIAVTYAVTSASPSGLVAFDNATATIAADSSGSDSAAVIGTPSAGGTYKITPSATGFTSIESSQTVTVLLPSISVTCYYYCPNVGVGLYLPADYYYGYLVHLSNPASGGGLTVNLVSTATSIATVPASVVVAAGQTDAWFRIDGVAAGAVQVQASAPGWSGSNRTITVLQADIQVTSVATARNTASQVNAVGVQLICGGSICGFAPGAIAATVGVTSATPAGLVTMGASTATIGVNDYQSGVTAIVNTPTATGTYRLTPTATGFNSVASGLVTVANAPTIYGSTSVGVGLTLTNYYYIQLNDAVAAPTTFTLTSSDTSKLVVPATVTISTGNNYAYFTVSGVAAGSGTITASLAGWTNATRTVTVAASSLVLYYLDTPRTANAGGADDFYAYARCGANYCGTFTADPVVTASASSGITAVTVSQALAGYDYITLSASQPTAAGTYTVTVGATVGSSTIGSVTSGTVTVN